MDNKEQKHIRKLAKKFTELKTLKQRVQFIEDNPLIRKKKSNSLWLLYVAGLLICFLFQRYYLGHIIHVKSG